MAEPSNATSTTPSATENQKASSSTTAFQSPPTCAQCSKAPDSLKQCNKCHSVPYCNKDCQKAHYKTHKKECAALAQKYMQEHAPKMASRAPPREANRNTGYQKWQFDT